MSPTLNSTTASSAAPTATSSAQLTSAANPLANEETFLKLLVSQLQNQDPLNPTDSNQFVSQLTSYSQLEQLIGIHGDTTNLVAAATGSGQTTPSTSTGTTSTRTSSTGTDSTGSNAAVTNSTSTNSSATDSTATTATTTGD